MVDVLSAIQTDIPENIQLTRLSIRGKIKMDKYTEPEDLKLDYSLIMQGISQGDLAESSVIDLRKDILKNDLLSATFDSVNLDSMNRLTGKGGKSMREFGLQGISTTGGGQ